MSMLNLYFGKDDAETDFTRNGLLQDGFLKTYIFDKIKSGDKTLVIGRKGTGKSALCLMLHKQLVKENSATIITPDAISADEIRRFEMVGIDDQQSKKLVWKYIFLVQISKFVLAIARKKWKKESSWPEELQKLRKFLVENNEVDDLSFQENFWRIINRISTSLTLKALGQSFELEANKAPNDGLKLSLKLEFLKKHLNAQLEKFKNISYYILIDQVDEIWSNDPSSNLMASGLLMASKEINSTFNNIYSIVFLRTDIYDQLHFFDKDKLRGDEEPIIWSEESLLKLILARAKISTKNPKMTLKDFWDNYFPLTVDDLPIADFILSHTLMRPRDIIQLCNHCVDTARREGHQDISITSLEQALDIYSGWKLNDLIGEYRVNYPFLNDLLILFSNTSYVIQRSRFETIYNRIQKAVEERYSNYRTFLSIDSVLNILYGIGFLGVERMGQTYYYYQDPRTVENTDRIFVVHPAFRNALRCISSIDVHPFSPSDELQRSNRHLYEMRRYRSPFRGNIEQTMYGKESYEFERLLERLIRIRKLLLKEKELPTEVMSEISRNLSLMMNELENNIKFGDPIQLEVIRISINRYLRSLCQKLTDNDILNRKSNLLYEITKLVDY